MTNDGMTIIHVLRAGAEVRIVDIDATGRIVTAQFDGVNITYKVDYWMNGDLKSVWLFEDQVKVRK